MVTGHNCSFMRGHWPGSTVGQSVIVGCISSPCARRFGSQRWCRCRLSWQRQGITTRTRGATTTRPHGATARAKKNRVHQSGDDRMDPGNSRNQVQSVGFRGISSYGLYHTEAESNRAIKEQIFLRPKSSKFVREVTTFPVVCQQRTNILYALIAAAQSIRRYPATGPAQFFPRFRPPIEPIPKVSRCAHSSCGL
jgi:hypothetical protein